MAKPRSRDSGRFRIYVSDRSGLEFGFKPVTSYPNAYTRESGKPVQDVNVKVSPSEFDQPPPSKKPLGGEGDVSNASIRANSDFAVDANLYVIPPESIKTILYINSSTSIQWNTDPVVYIAGSNVSQIMSANPQIVAGQQGYSLAFQCVGSSITILSSNGITFDFAASRVRMDSGSIITTIYNQTDNTWHVTSFSQNGGF